MRLPIEDWLVSQNVSIDARDLLEEAIVCYKASAYRASLLLSYLSFQTILKDRVLNSSKPDQYPDSLWRQNIQDLGEDEVWDTAVFEITKRAEGPVLFPLTEDLRQQLAFWRNRRNDCAHAKSNLIKAPHVESFWYFIQSNLPKFKVKGGKSSVLAKIKVHFTRSLTPVEADPDPILQEIPLAMPEREYRSFLDEVKEALYGGYPIEIYDNEQKLVFWHRMFRLQENFVVQLLQFMKANMKLFRAVLRYEPSIVRFCRNDPELIRSLWYAPGEDTNPRVVTALLRQQLVPAAQVEECVKRLIECQAILDPAELSEEEELKYLLENNFVELFRIYAFREGSISLFDWANHHKKRTVIWYLEKFGFDKDVVTALYSAFWSEHHPWHLRDAIRVLFTSRPELKEQYIDACREFDALTADRLL
ncbi:hypothetical protein J27TS7_16200 [Paenibacillus dendritiformis]|uniref:hypothetical protein n=1 Tax=Paenibacillus dendritiformis TaxID=130049 RepID=UPI001B0AEF55|nr:hypothetical protein [Paenibacillus dendritiformis]GIO72106.1 hypothetical protein J27TS7_16200 [Paenibacillus dendritiformis]